jgi:hypothetical protein
MPFFLILLTIQILCEQEHVANMSSVAVVKFVLMLYCRITSLMSSRTHSTWPLRCLWSGTSGGWNWSAQLQISEIVQCVVIPSHDPNVIFLLANNRTNVIVFY